MPEPPPIEGAEPRTASSPRPASRTLRTRTAAAETGKNKATEQTTLNRAKSSTANTTRSATAAPAAKAAKRVEEKLSPLQEVARGLTQIVATEKISGRVKQLLVGLLTFIEETGVAEGDKGNTSERNTDVSAMHKSIKADLSHMYSSIFKQLDTILSTASETLSTAEKVQKEVDSINDSTKDISGKVGRVSDATNKIADSTATYRDAVLKTQAQNPRSNVDPVVLSDLDHKARQILLEFSVATDTELLDKSLSEIKDNANKIINDMVSSGKPANARIESITKTRTKALILMLNSKEATLWLKEAENEDAFTENFAAGSYIKERRYNIVAPSVPIIFSPESAEQLREVEEVNGLPDFTIAKAKWIKPTNRRRTGQTHAYAILRITSAEAANRLIRDGLVICGARLRPNKLKQEPTQCMKCRGWGHFARDCSSEVDTCGTCGESHRTRSCTNVGKTYCISCKDHLHASWDRGCPEFIRRRATCDERNPENEMPFFPTEQDWTLTTRPIRIPLDERFPQRFAVNSLPHTGSKAHGGTPNPPRPETSEAPREPQRYRRKTSSKGKHYANPNNIPITRGRGAGDPSSAEHLEYLSGPEGQNRLHLRTDESDNPKTSAC